MQKMCSTALSPDQLSALKQNPYNFLLAFFSSLRIFPLVFHCIIRVLNFRLSWIVCSFVRSFVQYQHSSCIQSSVGCEIGKSCFLHFFSTYFSIVLNKHFLSYDDWWKKLDDFPNGIELELVRESSKNGKFNCGNTVMMMGWQMGRKVSISFCSARCLLSSSGTPY